MALAALIILATWLIARLVALVARLVFARRIESALLLSLVARAFAIPVFLLGVYFVLQFSGLTRLAIAVLGGTGLIGIIIGFSLRDIAENFLASILLSVRNPLHIGDLIDVGGHTGVVQNLNVRSTVLLTLDGNQVQIPNSTVYKGIIQNYSSIPSRRAEFTVGIGYDSSAAKAQILISEVLREHPAVLDMPEPQKPRAKLQAVPAQPLPPTIRAIRRPAKAPYPTRSRNCRISNPKATYRKHKKTYSRNSGPCSVPCGTLGSKNLQPDGKNDASHSPISI